MVETEKMENLLTSEEAWEVRKVILFYHSNLSNYDKKFEGDKSLASAYEKLGGKDFDQKRKLLQSTSLGYDMTPRFPDCVEDFHLISKIEEYGAGYKNVF